MRNLLISIINLSDSILSIDRFYTHTNIEVNQITHSKLIPARLLKRRRFKHKKLKWNLRFLLSRDCFFLCDVATFCALHSRNSIWTLRFFKTLSFTKYNKNSQGIIKGIKRKKIVFEHHRAWNAYKALFFNATVCLLCAFNLTFLQMHNWIFFFIYILCLQLCAVCANTERDISNVNCVSKCDFIIIIITAVAKIFTDAIVIMNK